MARFRVSFDPQASRSATTIEADSYDLDSELILRFYKGAGQQQKVVRMFAPWAKWWDIEPLVEGQP